MHADAGEIVRETMERVGKTLPEDLPIEAHIKEVKALVRKHDRQVKLN